MNTPNPNSNNPIDWKSRCVGLLDEYEKAKTKWQNSEKVLLRVVNRLTTVAAGLDATIRPHAENIRNLLRKGVEMDVLLDELDSLSTLLFQVAKAIKPASSLPKKDPFEPVFNFLQPQMISQKEIASLAALRQRSDRGEFVNEAAFFETLRDLLEEIINGRPQAKDEKKPNLLGRLFSGKKREDKVDLASIQRNLVVLLDVVEVPIGLQTTADRLREKLTSDIDADAFMSVFQEFVDFLSKIKADAQKEQKFFESFLSDLSGKLIGLEQQTLGFKSLAKASETGSANMHASFSKHVENLKTIASNATDVTQLKDLLSSRLEIISSYLSVERDAAEKRIKETEMQVTKLSTRLQELEMEAVELRTKLRVQHNLAMRDPLTGLPNRLAYDERIEQELARWKRFNSVFSLLVWDIDHFKAINDRFGHKAGDKALVTIGQTLIASIRETDFVSRFGGEEFVMLLPGTDTNGAMIVAEGIRANIEDCGFNSQGKPVKITISCGISQCRDHDTSDQLFERADKALYKAKNDGRNRCMIDNT